MRKFFVPCHDHAQQVLPSCCSRPVALCHRVEISTEGVRITVSCCVFCPNGASWRSPIFVGGVPFLPQYLKSRTHRAPPFTPHRPLQHRPSPCLPLDWITPDQHSSPRCNTTLQTHSESRLRKAAACCLCNRTFIQQPPVLKAEEGPFE